MKAHNLRMMDVRTNRTELLTDVFSERTHYRSDERERGKIRGSSGRVKGFNRSSDRIKLLSIIIHGSMGGYRSRSMVSTNGEEVCLR